MTLLKITVKEKSDTTPSFPEITDENKGGELILDKACILEGGMESGRPSIGFLLIDPATGKHYVAQTSPDLLDVVVGVLRGFELRLIGSKGGPA